ncbi:TPA: DNA-packaging protein FI [Salmonella enterica subsp. enterica serovar Chester]
MSSKEQNIQRLKELATLLGRDADVSGSAADVAQRVAEWEEELEADGAAGTDSESAVPLTADASGGNETDGLVRVRMLYTVHLNAVADDSDNEVALAQKGTCVRIPAEKLALLVQVGLVSQAGTLMAYGLYPDTFLPDQTDSVIKEVILTLVLGLTHAENVTLELDPQRMIITQDSGDKRYLRISEDLAEIAEKGEAAQARGRGHLGVYGQEESDSRFQPKGDYTPAGEAYTKQESDDRFQPKGNYTPAGEAYTKAESDNRFQAKGECYTKNQSDARYVQDEQLGAQSSIWTAPGSDTFVPAGCTQTGVHLSGDGSTGTHVEFLFYKPVQIYINGAWRTING